MMNELHTSDIPQYADYVRSIVAFIDILGFDSQSRRIQTEESFKKTIGPLCLFRQVQRSLEDADPKLQRLEVMAVSDSLILTMPVSSTFPAPMSIITLLHSVQHMALVSFETLIRGYVTRGMVYHRNGFLFGEGYSDSYKHEKGIGYAPRIVIAPDLVSEATQDISRSPGKYVDHLLNYLRRDADGRHFIDYFRPASMQDLEDLTQHVKHRGRINEFIRASLDKYCDVPDIRKKYEWLQEYFVSTHEFYAS